MFLSLRTPKRVDAKFQPSVSACARVRMTYLGLFRARAREGSSKATRKYTRVILACV